jgi:hypothetical protein
LLRRGGCRLLTIAIAAGVTLAAQQMPDRSFRPMIEDRAHAPGSGPVVCFDEGHGNLHTLNEGFWPFADLVRRDGYLVRPLTTTLDRQSLADCRILVIASPRSQIGETDQIRNWVAAGNSLLLIVDRDSLAGTSGLAPAFGVTFTEAPAKPATFRSMDGTLRPHAIARGRHAKESATSVTTFAGQAMRVPTTAESLLVASDGLVQGAVMRIETGRAAFFGDATLFTAQIAGPDRRLVGMNAPGAEQNFRFVLNVMHWLSGVI